MPCRSLATDIPEFRGHGVQSTEAEADIRGLADLYTAIPEFRGHGAQSTEAEFEVFWLVVLCREI